MGASRIIDSTLRDEIFIRELKRLHGIHTTKSWCIWMRRLIKDFRDKKHACNFNLIASVAAERFDEICAGDIGHGRRG